MPDPSTDSSSVMRVGETGDRLLDEVDTGEGERESRPRLDAGSRYMLWRRFWHAYRKSVNGKTAEIMLKKTLYVCFPYKFSHKSLQGQLGSSRVKNDTNQ